MYLRSHFDFVNRLNRLGGTREEEFDEEEREERRNLNPILILSPNCLGSNSTVSLVYKCFRLEQWVSF
ncbi:hypothetical protein QVD17_06033 [Tagetes erecta]|uniref:Uncharacterized protein n=1 Tax=Tagetes erecta TaxID=13708 RepID=A0AAD8PB01_TARER|nr:hypothetical protein QVD17_06033 [Tagetes erecta]